MIELIRAHQLNLMLMLCGACAILLLLLLMTQSISKRRKRELLLMDLMAFLLLWFDRLAYLYAGDPSTAGFFMVRISNFAVFFLTPGIVFGFNLYLSDIIINEGKLKTLPKRFQAVGILTLIAMLIAVISAFTGMLYYFDESNVYHRGKYFLFGYIIPVVGPLLQYSVIRQHRRIFSRQMYISLLLYIFVPIICGILQAYLYGISIINMSLVAVSICLYISTYIDINRTVEHLHESEIRNMQNEQAHLQRLFDQTATAFVSAVEKKDEFIKGNSVRIAEYARRIAKLSGKSDEEAQKVYYAALLHDVGMIGIPDSVIKNSTDPNKIDYDAIRKKPVIGREILSSITEYPYLSQAAYSSHERYNGTGYPEGLKGTDIPETARIIAVADAYVTMTTKKRYREARPEFVARETFIKGSGEQFDPHFADLMVRIIDADGSVQQQEDAVTTESAISCGDYRETVSGGIPVESAEKRISFHCIPSDTAPEQFSAPAIVLFDAYDKRIHSDEKTIAEYHYYEYGEFWFDGHMIPTGVRKTMVTKRILHEDNGESKRYEITAARFEDHLRLKLTGPALTKEIILALPDGTRSAYIGLTGEHCEITDITAEPTGENVGEGDIPRIAEAISFIDHIESDLRNIQVMRTRSASTEGIQIDRKFRLLFHTMSLPWANLIWHCPYIVLFSSDDGTVNGSNYREFALIKLNGENADAPNSVQNRFHMKKKPDFPGWDAWKEINRKGMECEVLFDRKGSRVTVKTENLGIDIEYTALIPESEPVYAALTGDQVALTDIRVIAEHLNTGISLNA